jgi:YD repeat-containing protein
MRRDYPGTYVYGYDNGNRVTTEVNAEGTVTYSYDSGGELLTARGSRTENYSYDSGGNRTMTGYTTGTGNELTASPGVTYTYDDEGNLASKTILNGVGTSTTSGFITPTTTATGWQVTIGNGGGPYTYDAWTDGSASRIMARRPGRVRQGRDRRRLRGFNSSGTLPSTSRPNRRRLFARTSSGV